MGIVHAVAGDDPHLDALGRLSRLRSSGKPETPLPATGSGKPNERIVTETQPTTVTLQVAKEPDAARGRGVAGQPDTETEAE